MAPFRNAYDSHEHSLEVLNLLYCYDSFLDNLSVIADMGCGAGFDASWWATLETRDEPPEPRNYTVYAVDKDIKQIEPDFLTKSPNLVPLAQDFENVALPRKADLIWCHDSLQYVRNPLSTLAIWKQSLNENGMLVLSVPQTTYLTYNRLTVSNYNNQFYSYNILNLMYMLAVSGFDCKDAYFYRKPNTPWLYAATYASPYQPMTSDATWYDLADKGLVNDSIINSVNKYGYARLEDTIVNWLDKNIYQITD